MLAITDLAADAIRSLAVDAQLPEGGGLRIAAPDPEQGLELTLAAGPSDDDIVLEGDRGLIVILEPIAADALQDKVLDVQEVPGENGEAELRFAINPQAEDDETP
jgi:Fe-S cluster assembly iron-binding protein IscA